MIANLTIAAIKELIAELNVRAGVVAVRVATPARKADYVNAVADEIVRVWDEAIKADEARTAEMDRLTAEYVSDFFDESDVLTTLMDEFVDTRFGDEMRVDAQYSRVMGYVAQRGSGSLTAAQWRRIRKNNRKHGLTTSIRPSGFVMVTVNV